MAQTNPIIHYRRVAVRKADSAPWEWFGPPIAFTLRHYDIAMAMLENLCVEAVYRYPTQHICTVQVPTKHAYDLADMTQF